MGNLFYIRLDLFKKYPLSYDKTFLQDFFQLSLEASDSTEERFTVFPQTVGYFHKSSLLEEI